MAQTVPCRGAFFPPNADAARRHDASDADAGVVRRQVARAQPPGDWVRLDATSDAESTQGRVREVLTARGIHVA